MAVNPGTMLIQGGTVVIGHAVERKDLLVRGERIEAVGDLDRAADIAEIAQLLALA